MEIICQSRRNYMSVCRFLLTWCKVRDKHSDYQGSKGRMSINRGLNGCAEMSSKGETQMQIKVLKLKLLAPNAGPLRAFASVKVGDLIIWSAHYPKAPRRCLGVGAECEVERFDRRNTLPSASVHPTGVEAAERSCHSFIPGKEM